MANYAENEIMIEFRYADTKPEHMLMHVPPGGSLLKAKGLLTLAQDEARSLEILGEHDRVTRLQYPGNKVYPTGTNIALSTPISHLKATLVKLKGISKDGALPLLAVVSRAPPVGGGLEERLPHRSASAGRINTDAKGGDLTQAAPPAVEGGSRGEDDGLIDLTNGDSPRSRASHNDSDKPEERAEEDSREAGLPRSNRAASDVRSPENGSISGISAPAEVVPAPVTSSSLCPRGVQKADRSTLSKTKKRKQPADEERAGIDETLADGIPAPGSKTRPERPHRASGIINNAQPLLQRPSTGNGPAGTSTNKCECGIFVATLGPPSASGLKEARWCLHCPSKAINAVDLRRKQKLCECGRQVPTYGVFGCALREGRWCAKCPTKPNGAIDFRQKHCECGRRVPSYGILSSRADGKKEPRWCSQCPTKPRNAVDVRHKRCECGKRARSFGLPGETSAEARWCSTCPSKPRNAVDVLHRRCACGKHSPSFGFPGGRGPKDALWCSMCPSKPLHAIDVLHRKCECGERSPSFGLPGGTGLKDAKWCSTCPSKPAEAVDVLHKRCECGKHGRSFGLPGARGLQDARWCSKCPTMPDDAVDIRQKRCECRRRNASLGPPGSSRLKEARWCPRCPTKPEDAVDVRPNRCECERHIPNFGLPGGSGVKDARWCSKCPSKPSDAVDVRHKRCECGSRIPTFGDSIQKSARWCAKCPSKPADAVVARQQKQRG